MQLWNFNNPTNVNKKKFPNIIIQLKNIQYISSFSNTSKFGGIKSFLPILELISDKQELFEELSGLILNLIKKAIILIF